jgi:predicted dehydrogenase
MKEKKQTAISRRKFIGNSIKTSLTLALPSIVPSTVFGKGAPSNRINVAAIGGGRIGRGHDIPGVWQYNYAQLMAVCDVDSLRAEDGKKLINDFYSKRDGKPFDGVKVYTDYRELLLNKDIDAVLISTPDHTHAMIGVAAARAGKHIYMQKPASLTIHEGRYNK